MEFFEHPQKRDTTPGPRYKNPLWTGPPENVLPGIVPVELVLARTEDVAICARRIAAYEEGFELELSAVARLQLDLDPFDFFGHLRRRGQVSPESLLFGFEFADGRKVTNLQDSMNLAEQPSDGSVGISSSGGGGSAGAWRRDYWVWPLPPDGPVIAVCEWPAVGIPLTRHEIDASTLHEAAGRAETLWELPEHPAQDAAD